MLRLLRGLVALAVVAALLIGAPRSGLPASENNLAAALDAYARNDLARAHDLLLPLAAGTGASAGRAAYLLGVVELLQKRFPEAAATFGQAAQALPVLADHARYYQAVAAFDNGEFAPAAQGFQQVLTAFPDSTLRGLALFWRAESLLGARSPGAPPAFHAYLAGFGQGRHAAQAWFDMGAALEQQGRWADAAQAYRRVLWVFETSRDAAPARERLAALAASHALPPDATPPEAVYQRAVADFEAGHVTSAGAEFGHALRMKDGWHVAGGALYHLGVIAFEARRFGQAAARFQQGAALGQAHADDSLYYLVRIALAQGREADALRTARALAQNYPRSSLAPRGLYLIAADRQDRGAVGPAAGLYREAGERFPGTEWGGLALWRLGWIHYQERAWGFARTAWLRLAGTASDGDLAAAGLYWAARAAVAAGGAAAAAEDYGRAAAQYGDTYSGQLASAHLGLPVRVQVTPDPPPVPDGRMTHLDRFRELDALAQGDDATQELEAATGAAPASDRVSVAVLLSQRYEEQSRFAEGILVAERARRLDAPGQGRGAPLALWEALYPQGNWDAISAAAARTGIDPYLVAGVIREESRFDPVAVSPAGAAGLMQLMPGTARSAARNAGVRLADRRTPTDPKTNVLLGSVVLGELLKEFGRPELAVAAYNAGPAAVHRWLAQHPGADPASFVQQIPYPETRTYVQNVLQSAAMYRWLYKDGHPSPTQ